MKSLKARKVKLSSLQDNLLVKDQKAKYVSKFFLF